MMMSEYDVIIVVPVAVASMQTGLRAVLVDAEHRCHVVHQPAGAEIGMTELSFTAQDAVGMAKAVLSGETRACTSPTALRVLAAAFLTCALDEPDDAGTGWLA